MVAYPSNWLVLFPLAFSLFIALRLSEGSVDQDRTTIGGRLVRYVIALLFGFALLATGLRPNFMTTIWVVMLALFGFITYWKSRRLERSALLMTAQSAKNLSQQQSLLGYFVEENVGWVRRKASILRRDLAAGVPWVRALEVRGIATGVYERLALRLRATYGQGRPQDSRQPGSFLLSPMQVESEAERLFGRLMVFSWVIFVVPIISLIMVFIIPTFKMMFEEFGLELPGPTLAMIQLSDWSVEFLVAHFVALIPLVLVAGGALAASIWLYPSLLQMPLLRWSCSDYYRNAGFVALANVMQHEQDLLSACRQTANLVPIAHVGQQFRSAVLLLEGGSSPADAFLKSRLISQRELKAFGQGLDTRDPCWALQQLASWKTERMLRRYSVVVQVLMVAITLMLAVVVGLVAVGVISALTSMVMSLS